MEQSWLRTTHYAPGRADPVMTTVMPKDGLKMDIHLAANETRERFGRTVDVEIFEWEDDLVSATVEAQRRAATRITGSRGHRDTLRDFLIAYFFRTEPTTVIAPRSPAPLSVDEIREVFGTVKGHPEYKNRTVRVVSCEGVEVWLKDGEITVG